MDLAVAVFLAITLPLSDECGRNKTITQQSTQGNEAMFFSRHTTTIFFLLTLVCPPLFAMNDDPYTGQGSPHAGQGSPRPPLPRKASIKPKAALTPAQLAHQFYPDNTNALDWHKKDLQLQQQMSELLTKDHPEIKLSNLGVSLQHDRHQAQCLERERDSFGAQKVAELATLSSILLHKKTAEEQPRSLLWAAVEAQHKLTTFALLTFSSWKNCDIQNILTSLPHTDPDYLQNDTLFFKNILSAYLVKIE